jgi:hypothetical protein
MNLLDLMIGLIGRFLSKKPYPRYIDWFARKEDPSLARNSGECSLRGADLGDSERTRVEECRSVDEFFTRRPQPGVRPLNSLRRSAGRSIRANGLRLSSDHHV